MKTIVGYHDYAMSAPLVLDNSTSLSWLRSFEKISDQANCHAVLREPNYTRSIEGKIRGVSYSFIEGHLSNHLEAIAQIKPDVIMLNICWYSQSIELIERLKDMFPKAKIIGRLHHDYKYLCDQKHPIDDFISKVHELVVPTQYALKQIQQNHKLRIPFHVLGFGVDVNFFSEFADQKKRTVKAVSAIGPNPTKNHELLNYIFSELRDQGFKASNLQGLTKTEFRKSLAEAEYFFSLRFPKQADHVYYSKQLPLDVIQ